MIGSKKVGLVSGKLIQAKNQTDVLSSYGVTPNQEQSPAVHVASSLNLFSPYGLSLSSAHPVGLVWLQDFFSKVPITSKRILLF
jgi:hypothetical protein